MRLAKAIQIIALSTIPLVVTIAAVFYMRFSTPPKCTIEGLKVKSNVPIPTHFIAEVLDLSADCPVSFDQFDLKWAKQRLCETAVIDKAEVHCRRPNLLDIDLHVRKPIAILGDFTNTGIDANGFLFALDPIYPSCRLPVIYLGSLCPKTLWGDQIDPSYLTILQEYPFVTTLDWSKSKQDSLGSRLVVLETKQGDLIRSFPGNLDEALQCYERLKKMMDETSRIIDLRLSSVAYVKDRYE